MCQTYQLSRIERETHAFPHCLTQFLKNLIFHAISRIFDFWKNFPQFLNFGKKVSSIFRFPKKSFPDFPISGNMFPRFPGFWKKVSPIFRFSEKVFPISDFGKSENRAKISDIASKFLSHAKWTSQVGRSGCATKYLYVTFRIRPKEKIISCKN